MPLADHTLNRPAADATSVCGKLIRLHFRVGFAIVVELGDYLHIAVRTLIRRAIAAFRSIFAARASAPASFRELRCPGPSVFQIYTVGDTFGDLGKTTGI